MAANTSDLFKKVGAGTVTTLAAPGKALGATSINVGSTTNYPTDTGIVIAIRTVDSDGKLVAGTYTEWSAKVTSATSLEIVATPVYGDDQVYPAGSTTQVLIPTSSYAQNKLIEGILTEHNQNGKHTTDVLKTIYPIGSVYISVVSTNPNTLFGFGTWVSFATGRTLVGIDSGQTEFDVVEETGGEKTHTLTSTEMPSHKHTYPISGVDGTDIALAQGGAVALYKDTTNTGSGNAHNNLQPYIVVHMWKRTA